MVYISWKKKIEICVNLHECFLTVINLFYLETVMVNPNLHEYYQLCWKF